jgi:hypothetical protein
MDISAVGARVRSRGKPPVREGQALPVTIQAPAGLIRLSCLIVWSRKVAFRQWDLGLKFVDVPEEARTGLNMLARGMASESERCRGDG